jgi:hypothetical protein
VRRAPLQGISERTDMEHDEPPKRIKRLLREFAAKAHEEELRRALTPLAHAFERWSSRSARSRALWLQGPTSAAGEARSRA